MFLMEPGFVRETQLKLQDTFSLDDEVLLLRKYKTCQRFTSVPHSIAKFWESAIGLCCIVRYFMSILVLQSS